MFPHLFPCGTGYFMSGEMNRMSHSTYIRLRFFDINQTFGTDNGYIGFESYNRTVRDMTRTLHTLPGGKLNRKFKFYQDDSPESEVAKYKRDKTSAHMTGFKYLNKIPDTPGYWNVIQQEVLALIEHFGPPTFFNTYTVNETQWFHLTRRLYGAKFHKPLSRETFQSISKQEILKLCQEHTALFVAYVYRLFTSFLNKVLTYFFGEMTHSSIRVEFQKRGAPHFHCLFWVKNAPAIDFEKQRTANDVQKYIQFIDTFITTNTSSLNSNLQSAYSHKCRKETPNRQGCLRRRADDTQYCKIQCPKIPIENTLCILREDCELVTSEKISNAREHINTMLRSSMPNRMATVLHSLQQMLQNGMGNNCHRCTI